MQFPSVAPREFFRLLSCCRRLLGGVAIAVVLSGCAAMRDDQGHLVGDARWQPPKRGFEGEVTADALPLNRDTVMNLFLGYADRSRDFRSVADFFAVAHPLVKADLAARQASGMPDVYTGAEAEREFEKQKSQAGVLTDRYYTSVVISMTMIPAYAYGVLSFGYTDPGINTFPNSWSPPLFQRAGMSMDNQVPAAFVFTTGEPRAMHVDMPVNAAQAQRIMMRAQTNTPPRFRVFTGARITGCRVEGRTMMAQPDLRCVAVPTGYAVTEVDPRDPEKMNLPEIPGARVTPR